MLSTASRCRFSVWLLALAIAFLASSSVSAGDKTKFQWKDSNDKGHADLNFGDQPVLRYMYAYDRSTPERTHETFKVFHHVFGPKSDQIITKGPGGLYTHHRGLFLGWNKTSFEKQSLDFWHCRKGEHLRHARFLKLEGDEKRGTMTAEIHWNDREDKIVILETRTVTASIEASTGGWQLDWTTMLQSKRGPITLDGDRQHAGFQFRAAQAVAQAKGARYIRPKGFPEQAEAFQVGKGNPPKHVNLNWFAMTFQVAGKRYTAEYFEDPSLPKPSRYSERPYGRFGAFFKTTLKPDQPLKMRYRIVVSQGEAPGRDAVQERYDMFVADLKKTK